MPGNLTLLRRITASAHTRHGIWYLGSNLAAAAVPFFLLPFLTHTLTPVAYGQYSLFTLTISALMPLVTWMFTAIIAREYSLREPSRFADFFRTCLVIILSLAVLWAMLAILFHPLIFNILALPLLWVLLAVPCALALGLVAMMQSLSAMRKQPIQYSYWRLGFALAIGLALLLGASMGDGNWNFMGYGQSLVSVLVLFVILRAADKHGWLPRQTDLSTARHDATLAFHYSTPLVIHTLTAGFLLQCTDRLFVSHYLGLAEAGHYNAAQQISLAMALLVTSMNQVWQPWINARLKENTATAKAKVVRAIFFGFIGLWGLGACATFCVWLAFPYLIGESFQNAHDVVPILMISGIVNGMYVLVAAPLFFYGNTLQIMWCNIGTALVTLALNALLVPVYGMMGAAFATLTATCFMFVAIWVTCIRLYDLPWLRAFKNA